MCVLAELLSKLINQIIWTEITFRQSFYFNCRSQQGCVGACRDSYYIKGVYLIDISAAFLCRSVIEEVLCCCLHLSAAFDTINHSLLKRLHGEIFVRGTVLEWLTSYLSGRFQQVLVGLSYSAETPLLRGVPLITTFFCR